MARRTLLTRLLFTGFTTAGLWLIGEAAVTAFYGHELAAYDSPTPSTVQGAPNMPGNPYLIYEIPPGERYEQGVTLHMNSLGLRGDEVELPKPKGERRFLTTGDSSVFGFGVEDDEVFHEVAEDMLGEKVNGMTAAIPGYSTYQTINFLRMRALKTEPDLIVVANLWSDNNFDGWEDKKLLASYGAYEESFAARLRSVFAGSAIFRILDWRLRVRPSVENAHQIVTWMTNEQAPGERRVAIQDYAENLETLTRIAKEVGAEVMFVVLANNEDLDPDKTAERMAWTPYRDVMRDTAARHGAPVLEVPELFKASGLSRGELFLDEMHPTATGHKLMGEALGAILKEKGWAEGKPLLGKGTGGPIPTYRDPFIEGQAPAGDPNGSPTGPSTPGGQGDPGAQGGSGAQGDPGAGPPQGGSGGASGDPGAAGANLSGELVFAGYAQGAVLIDAIPPGDPNPKVLGSTRLSAPGKFHLFVGSAQKVALRVYIDADGDGPDGDDKRIDLGDSPIDMSGGPVEGVIINVDKGKLVVP